MSVNPLREKGKKKKKKSKINSRSIKSREVRMVQVKDPISGKIIEQEVEYIVFKPRSESGTIIHEDDLLEKINLSFTEVPIDIDIDA